MGQRKEYCVDCEEPTGRAGIGEDSLYIEDEGPFCEECFEARTREANTAAHQEEPRND